ncbi:MAG: pyridoxal phosphate-dependent aminotransferase [Bacteroidales bacterium]|nr:pyridoxal phosphate-dependent aminotransferase [Bacteroidales bacterium]
MPEIPIPAELIRKLAMQTGVDHPGKASIREIVNLVNLIEKNTGIRFVRMEMGVPGLKPPGIALKAETDALAEGIASIYPPIEGVDVLKTEASRFVKLFLNAEVNPAGCIPTCGSMQGSMICFLTVNRTDPYRKRTLFIDPGFPVHKQQCQVIGDEYDSFDIYEYRGKKLKAKIKSHLESGKVSSILYSNPNNPSWICLDEEELQILGELATDYDTVVIEDLAYFGMDFRKDISVPGIKPFQSTIASYTDNYVILISSSKVFSYAGQRIALMVISDGLFNRRYPGLKRFYTSEVLGHTMIYGALYALSAGAPHSAQKAVAAILKAANDGTYNILNDIRQYGERARYIKKVFTDNGFRIVYDRDQDVPIADGFYFTISYPGFTGSELLEKLLHYGISAITLDITGSNRAEGLRACVSQTGPELYRDLEERLRIFNTDHL